MLDLRLVGIHDDGENLVLESNDGTSYRLPIDQNLRTSIAKARRMSPARSLGSNGAFGPRDIQTRFRQGATVDEIVAESGWDANRVRRYEWPIIAERANIIQSAQNVMISASASARRSSDYPALSLRDHITQVAEKYSFSPDDAQWNTWQQESGQWTVSVDFPFTTEVRNSLPRGAVFPARWNYNPANQSIYASNEAAYFLMGRDHTTDAPLPGIGTHEDTPVQVAEPKVTEVRVPHNPSHNELLDELTARRGTPVVKNEESPEESAPRSSAFYTATETASSRRGTPEERKLAELLERARRSSQRPAVQTTQPAEEPAKTSPTNANHGAASQSEPTNIRSAVTAESDKQDKAPEKAGQQVTDTEISAEEINATETQSSESIIIEQAAHREVQEEPTPAESVSASTGTTETAVSVNKTHSEVTNSEESKPETLRESSQTNVVSPENNVESKNTDEAEAKAPQRPTARSKRTSVPSWDDIIFGNQRRG